MSAGYRFLQMDFGGGARFADPGNKGQPVFSMNITPDASGIQHYDESLFIEVLRAGSIKGRMLSHIMPFNFFRNVTDLRPARHLGVHQVTSARETPDIQHRAADAMPTVQTAAWIWGFERREELRLRGSGLRLKRLKGSEARRRQVLRGAPRHWSGHTGLSKCPTLTIWCSQGYGQDLTTNDIFEPTSCCRFRKSPRRRRTATKSFFRSFINLQSCGCKQFACFEIETGTGLIDRDENMVARVAAPARVRRARSRAGQYPECSSIWRRGTITACGRRSGMAADSIRLDSG